MGPPTTVIIAVYTTAALVVASIGGESNNTADVIPPLLHRFLPLSSKPSLSPFPRRWCNGGDDDVMYNDGQTRGDEVERLELKFQSQSPEFQYFQYL
ncbi:hypothetical protein PIB30_095910 [Stylosanthes scabra]|uniref:Uncharacterized protein n=1 Tax=Stylosanthes scabra TaxID=79078 RepID=A0ABU6UYC4_9FABA|nr:hypothetical protein [Stylosanthes scabra]